jgi:hypothetical protein
MNSHLDSQNFNGYESAYGFYKFLINSHLDPPDPIWIRADVTCWFLWTYCLHSFLFSNQLLLLKCFKKTVRKIKRKFQPIYRIYLKHQHATDLLCPLSSSHIAKHTKETYFEISFPKSPLIAKPGSSCLIRDSPTNTYKKNNPNQKLGLSS